MAAPLQGLWVFSHVVQWADGLAHDESSPSPLSLITKFKAELLLQRDRLLLSAAQAATSSVPVQVEGQVLDLRVPPCTTAKQLVAAEQRWHPPGCIVDLQADGLQLPNDSLLQAVHDNCRLELKVRPKVQAAVELPQVILEAGQRYCCASWGYWLFRF